MPSESTLRVRGLTKLDKKQLSDPGITFTEETLDDHAHGEVVTLVAIVTTSAIGALAAYFLRKHRGESFEETVEEVRPDGTIKRRVVKYSKSSSEAPDAAVIAQLRGSL